VIKTVLQKLTCRGCVSGIRARKEKGDFLITAGITAALLNRLRPHADKERTSFGCISNAHV